MGVYAISLETRHQLSLSQNFKSKLSVFMILEEVHFSSNAHARITSLKFFGHMTRGLERMLSKT